jgi:acyl-coenzyme A synthetase/AMP-(fatty) acid ligase
VPFAPASDATACIGTSGDIGYRELYLAASRLGERLSQFSAGSEVLVACEDRCDLAIGLLGAWSAGVAVALPPNLRAGTLAELCSGGRVRAIVGRGLPGQLGSVVQVDLDELDEVAPSSESLERWTRELELTQHLVTVYTSGTTGRHQPCEKSMEQLLGETALLQTFFGLQPGRVVLATVPSHHIYGLLFGLLLPLFAGARFVRAAPLHVEAIGAALARYAVTDLVSVPAHLEGLSKLPRGALAPVSRIFSSAAPLAPNVAALLREEHGIEVVEMLGSTETGGIAWRNDSGPWQPLPGVTVGHASDGTIEIHSPFLAAKDRPIFRGHDKIELVKGGNFLHLGREDGVVKVAGKRVALQEIEACARQLSGIDDVAALVLDGSSLRGVEIGLVVAGASSQKEALKDVLLERFDRVVLPRRFRFVAALPRESSGKLSQQRLLELFAEPTQDREE